MLLSEFSDREVITVTPQTTVREATRRMETENVGAVVIVDNDNKVVGILTDRDVALSVVAGDATAETAVELVMTKNVTTIWDDEGIFNATQYLLGRKVRRLPVINRKDELVGMITADDILALLAREFVNVAKSLEPALPTRV